MIFALAAIAIATAGLLEGLERFFKEADPVLGARRAAFRASRQAYGLGDE